MSICNHPTGDLGQQYEVRATNNGKEFIIGWTNEVDGGALMKSAKLWPSMENPYVFDRLKIEPRLKK